jgi:hypothetical protein
MQRIWYSAWVCGLLTVGILVGAARPAHADEEEARAVTLAAAGAAVTVDPATGNVVSVLLDGKAELAEPHPAGSEKPYGYLEVVDQLDHRTYNPLTARSTITEWKVTGEGQARRLSFAQQFEKAPFRIVHTFRSTPAGLRWEAALRLGEDQTANRSVQVNWVLPVPRLWDFWGPNSLDAHKTDGITPYRYIYGHTDPGPMATIIPLVGVWGEKGGAAVFSPPDVRKSQIIFEIHTQGLADVGTGVFRHVEDMQSLRVAHHMVGLRPGKDLSLAVCIAGCRPDWRGVLGHYVSNYPELFEPIAETRQHEGMYGITTPRGWLSSRGRQASSSLKAAGATCLEVHSHFLEYGYYISREFIDNPETMFECRPHPRNGPNSYAQDRRVFQEMMKMGIGPFAYFYNVHSLPDTIAKRYPGEMMLDEQGKPEIQWEKEPAVVAQPDSAFGRNLLEQIRLLIEAYPEVPGFFVDNYGIQKIDFGHDDGVTMVHNRPCYDLNRNHQDIGTRCFEIAHKARKVMMVNKLATIESAKGVDMVLVEGADVVSMRVHALACPTRAFFPLLWQHPDKAHWSERCLQCVLVWGGTPDTELMRDAATVKAYRPLTDAMIGKRWVFDADPVTLPAGYNGQIFRIDAQARHAGDVVVTVVDEAKSWKDEKFVEDLDVIVRLPEAGQLGKVTWLGVEKSGEGPQECEFTRDGEAIKVNLPPVGAAGVLRLSRSAAK